MADVGKLNVKHTRFANLKCYVGIKTANFFHFCFCGCSLTKDVWVSFPNSNTNRLKRVCRIGDILHALTGFGGTGLPFKATVPEMTTSS